MMESGWQETAGRWLAADQAGRDMEAEAEFGALLRARTTTVPSATLEARIWQATRWVRVRNKVLILARRFGLPAATVVAGAAGLYYSVTLVLPLVAQALVRGIAWLVRGFVWVTLAFTEGIDTWSLLAQLGRALGDAIATPEVTAALIIIQLIGILAFHLLNRVLAREKETSQ
ncbi:MAG TPA: hypothetical protein VH701_17495 [Vicinamibacterales bacterium]|jgi:hypothetical protein